MYAFTDPMHDVDFTWWDSLRYYYYYFEHAYSDYAFVVQVSYFMTVLSVVSIFLLFVFMLVVWMRRSRAKRYRKRFAKYYEPRFVAVLNDPRKLTDSECHEIVERRPMKTSTLWQYREQLGLLIDVYADIRSHQLSEEVRRVFYHNLRTLMAYLGIDIYMEQRLREGIKVDRLFIMQVVQQFHMNVAESTLARLYDTKSLALRKVVRIYYMWMSKEDPFRFMEERHADDFLMIDTLMIHRVFAMRKAAGKQLPPLLPYVENSHDEAERAFMICEVGWWSTDEEMEGLAEYFDCDDELCRTAAIAAVGRRRYQPLEQKLISIYDMQTEELRQVILRAVMLIQSGRAVNFFVKAARQTTSAKTYRFALGCLWNYGEAGRNTFISLEAEATEEGKALFEYVRTRDVKQWSTYKGMRMATETNTQ